MSRPVLCGSCGTYLYDSTQGNLEISSSHDCVSIRSIYYMCKEILEKLKEV